MVQCSRPECQTTAGCKCLAVMPGMVNGIDFAWGVQKRWVPVMDARTRPAHYTPPRGYQAEDSGND